ncbi:transposase [Streptomyces cinereoruber]|uniref:transposase n=1 Tax=Streptomyces cinereoruber TaxID=67260 RepID=UPI0036502CE1
MRGIAKPLIPPSKVRPQSGGTQDAPDGTLFAEIVHVLVSGCARRALPPCFGMSKSTVHRRFLVWSRAGVRGRLHEESLRRLHDMGLLDLSRAVLDSVRIQARKVANTQARAPRETDRHPHRPQGHRVRRTTRPGGGMLGSNAIQLQLRADRHCAPFAVTLTGDNRHDVTQLLPLLDAIPSSGPNVRGAAPGAPKAGRNFDEELSRSSRNTLPQDK